MEGRVNVSAITPNTHLRATSQVGMPRIRKAGWLAIRVSSLDRKLGRTRSATSLRFASKLWWAGSGLQINNFRIHDLSEYARGKMSSETFLCVQTPGKA
jgi:hypothetical protein